MKKMRKEEKKMNYKAMKDRLDARFMHFYLNK